MRFMFYSTTTGSRLHVANMHQVIYLCVIFVSANTKIFTTHRSHISFLERGATTFEKVNSSIKTPWYLVGNIQRSPQATPKAPDVKELPEPLLDSASIPVDGRGRPLSFPGTSTHRPLPKCCPKGERLDARLERCEGGGGEGGGHLLTLRESESSSEGLRCGYGEILRLGAAEAADSARQLVDEGLILKVREGNGSTEVVLSPGDFCADSAEGPLGPFALLLCPCAYTTCVRKCCPKGQLMVVHEKGIVQVDARCEALSNGELAFQPRIEDATEDDGEMRKVTGGQGERKGFIELEGAWPAACPSGYVRLPPSWAPPYTGQDFKVFRDGSAFIYSAKSGKRVPSHNYCVDNERRVSGILVESIVYCSEPLGMPLVDPWLIVVKVVCALASLGAVIVHCVLPEMRATPFGRSLMCYAAAILFADVAAFLWTLSRNLSGSWCIINVILAQYFMLATVFWLNVMCYDMGIAFRSYRRPLERTGSVADRRFMRYSLYAWGCPLPITFIMLCLQFTQSPGDPWHPIENYFTCGSNSRMLLLVYVPMLILLLANLTQFIWTACRIRFLQKDSEILREDEQSKKTSMHISKKQLLVFLKLMLVMGLIETVFITVHYTWFGLKRSLSRDDMAFYYWMYIVQLFRCLSIFALSCCKGRVFARLKERLPFCPHRNRGAPARVRPVIIPQSTQSSGLNSPDVHSTRNTTVAGDRKTLAGDNRVTGNTVVCNNFSDKTGIRCRISVGEKSPEVRLNPFDELSDDCINPVVKRTNRTSSENTTGSSGINTSGSGNFDISKDTLSGKDIFGTSRATINGTISAKNDLNNKPTGDIKIRVVSNTSP